MTDADRLLKYVFQHGKGWGPDRGVEPFRFEGWIGLPRPELGQVLDRLITRGLVGCDMEATTPFNDPSCLKGVRLLNVYLTEKGWDAAGKLADLPAD